MSQRSSDAEEEGEGEGDAAAVPVISLTIINVHPSHVNDAMLYLSPEIDIAEAAGAKIVVKVCMKYCTYHLSFPTSIIPYRATTRGAWRD